MNLLMKKIANLALMALTFSDLESGSSSGYESDEKDREYHNLS